MVLSQSRENKFMKGVNYEKKDFCSSIIKLGA